jgi:protein-disulfide isomerase
MRILHFAALLCAPLFFGAAADAAQKAAPAVDWTRTVAETPEGGFRMGNPAAQVKLVEYGSLTCPHCADFSKKAMTGLRNQVRTGKVSFEFRNFVLNGIDVAATMLARCGGPAGFFPIAEAMYATQPQWVGKISGLSAAEKSRLQALPAGQRLGQLAEIGGLTAIAAKGGVGAARAKQCLADEAALQRLGEMNEAASALGVQGTPTFLINGAMVHAHDWAELETLIKRAAG